jgi:hypothetical protein
MFHTTLQYFYQCNPHALEHISQHIHSLNTPLQLVPTQNHCQGCAKVKLAKFNGFRIRITIIVFMELAQLSVFLLFRIYSQFTLCLCCSVFTLLANWSFQTPWAAGFVKIPASRRNCFRKNRIVCLFCSVSFALLSIPLARLRSIPHCSLRCSSFRSFFSCTFRLLCCLTC